MSDVVPGPEVSVEQIGMPLLTEIGAAIGQITVARAVRTELLGSASQLEAEAKGMRKQGEADLVSAIETAHEQVASASEQRTLAPTQLLRAFYEVHAQTPNSYYADIDIDKSLEVFADLKVGTPVMLNDSWRDSGVIATDPTLKIKNGRHSTGERFRESSAGVHFKLSCFNSTTGEVGQRPISVSVRSLSSAWVGKQRIQSYLDEVEYKRWVDPSDHDGYVSNNGIFLNILKRNLDNLEKLGFEFDQNSVIGQQHRASATSRMNLRRSMTRRLNL